MSERTGYVNGKQTETYRIWSGMKNRCCNPNNKAFARYGARGIGVCDRWLSFANFLDDMGTRPSGLTLDRINNERGYMPENCRWADWRTQRRNTSYVIKAHVDGEEVLLVEASERFGLNPRSVRRRLSLGWTKEQALGLVERPKHSRRAPLCAVGHARSESSDGRWRCNVCRAQRQRDYHRRKRATSRG